MKSLKESTVQLTDAEKKVLKSVVSTRNRFVARYPLPFGLLITFGFVCTLYGFEKLIDNTELFQNNPWVILATGLGTLIATGAIYEKLK